MEPRSRWSWFVVWGAICCALAGCGGEELSRVRFVHASPDLPAVDIYMDEQERPVFTQVAYGMTTDALELSASTRVFHFRPAGGGRELPPLHSSPPVVLEEGGEVSLVAAGLLGADTSEAALRVLSLTEDFAPSAPGRVRVRIAHMSVDAPTLDIDTDGGGSAEVRGLSRFTDSGAAGLELPAGTALRFSIRSGDPRTQAVAFTVQPLAEGSEVLLVVTGLLSSAPREPEGFSLLIADATASQARVRPDPVVHVLNASEDAGPLDVFLGTREQAGQLGFGALSAPISVSPGQETLDVFPASITESRPAGPPLLALSTATLMSGERYLLIASGTPGEPENSRATFMMSPYAEGFLADEAQARLRFIHASASAPVMDAAPLDRGARLPNEATFNDVAYTGDSPAEGQPVSPVEFSLGVRPAVLSTDTPETRFDISPAPRAGVGLFGVLAGRFTPGDTGQLRLLLVDTSSTPWSVQVLTPSGSF